MKTAGEGRVWGPCDPGAIKFDRDAASGGVVEGSKRQVRASTPRFRARASLLLRKAFVIATTCEIK